MPLTPIAIKEYTALITQSGTNAPQAIILKNTLGATPTWTRLEEGVYNLVLNEAFPQYKTTLPNLYNFDGAGETYIPISDGNGTPSAIIGYYSIYRSSNNAIEIIITDATHNKAEWSDILTTSALAINIQTYA